ncbi:DHH family phosphoesterase [Desulfurobacterium sp.]|uniref:single-stranded-DNA-specific exonuclease RecJ n=1 Tax=Desulfurobacterium sp. TaxID=2004706 RepID=UPI0026067FDC|nr:DHH family phosphoesterase [Desulfurobacterium sp.]
MRTKWVYLNEINRLPEDIKTKYGKVFGQIFHNRGYKIIRPELKYFPKAENYPKIEQVASRIIEWINNGEKIGIFGDYDVDGITSVVIFTELLDRLGVKYSVKFPTRETGYGVKKKDIDHFIREGIKKVILFDNGTSFNEVLRYARENGVEVIVVDHHEEKEKTEVELLLNPKADNVELFRDLCTAGLSFYLTGVINSKMGKPLVMKKLLPITAVGTVADVVPLSDINRIIVRNGMTKFDETEQIGLKQLKELSGIKEVNEYSIGFIIAPRLNAAGRLSDPYIAYQLLKTDSELEAYKIANELERLNRKRQYETDKALESLLLQINPKDKVNILTGKFKKGIVGILAGKIARLTSKPTIVGTEVNGIVYASGRSVEGVNIVDLLSQVRDLLITYGGHDMACGLAFEIKNIEKLRERLNLLLSDFEYEQVIEIDLPLDINYWTPQRASFLEKVGPYGNGNERPVFSSFAEVVNVKEYNKLYILGVKEKGRYYKVKAWKSEVPSIQKGKVEIAYSIIGKRNGEEPEIFLKGIRDGDRGDQ